MKKFVTLFLILYFIIPINISGVSTSATSAIMMDMDSKRILYGKDIHNVRSVASISKIMTAVIAVESGKLDDIVTVGDEINKSYGSGIYIKKGEQISLRDLVYGLMLRSGNDASYAIATYVGGENFIDMMNTKAEEIGMNDTVFNNPNGLDEEAANYSTVYDMALLTSYAMKLEEYKKIVNTKTHTLKTNMNTYFWTNKHKLLFQYDYTTGGKTGFTKKAKRTLVSTASKDNLNLVVVTLNDGNDFVDHVRLFEHGFDNYKSASILKKGELSIYDEIYYGSYYLHLLKDYSYAIMEDEELLIKFELEEDPKEGETGVVKVLIDNKEVYRDIIYAKKLKVHRKSLMDWFKSLW
jgi:D-alanyl-D-alanine carboxypeptidase